MRVRRCRHDKIQEPQISTDTDTQFDHATFEDGAARHWRIGGLDLFVLRAEGAWYLQSTVRALEPDERPAVILGEPVAWVPDNSETEVVRYHGGSARSGGVLALHPALPDRAVVSRPREPFVLLPGHQALLYVGVPLWVGIHAEDIEVPLALLPTVQLPDTWFGPSTMKGEHCYAARTRCRTRIEDLPSLPWRVTVPLRLHNRARDGWLLERVALPVDLLPVFRTSGGDFWSSELAVVRSGNGDVGDVTTDARAPEGRAAVRVAAARSDSGTSLLGRFYGKLF
ncbi:MAG TPA: hypothetical protein VLA56_06175 [Pseudomonadales bacterium]|nr:hypothetical protein [Pseudomonadales bacterium]